jgi:hypothetical protein
MPHVHAMMVPVLVAQAVDFVHHATVLASVFRAVHGITTLGGAVMVA